MRASLNSKNSLSMQLFRLIFGLYCLIAISVTSIQIIEEYRYTQTAISDELKTYQHIFGPVLAKALWNLDREHINDITKGFIEVPIIVGIKIERLQNNALMPYAHRHIDETSLTTNNKLTYSFPIEFKVADSTQALGQATIYSDSSIVLNRVKLGFIFLIINSLIKGIALWIIFWWASNKLLISPLKTLTKSISDLKFDNLSSFNIDLKIKKENELSIIQKSFTEMISELYQAKKHVSSFNQRLEKEVIQRTIELENSKNEAEILTRFAESATKAKSKFLAVMSHELRTPMNGIQGMLYLLGESKLDEKQKHYIDVATNSSSGLLSLIDDILDLSRIETGKYVIDHSIFEVHPIFNELLKSFSLGLKDNSVDIILDAENIRTLEAIGDPLRLRQVLTNLIGNAIKFTPQGQVIISTKIIESVDLDADKFYLSTSIQDTGIGIAQKNITHIFDSFTQEDASTTREYGGSGLGLTICKQLCELMAGGIEVTSEQGKGSCFTFYVCLQKVNV